MDLLAIAERRDDRGASKAKVLIGKSSYSASELREADEKIKIIISNAIDKKVDTDIHREFVRAVHRPIRVGKTNQNSKVDYLVLNYDTLIENALAIERITFSDGIDGGVTGWWNPETFNQKVLEARVLKLHGSIDWCEIAGDSLPRRIAPKLTVKDMLDRRILIWPASTKYRETQLDPFAQLSEQTRRILRPTENSQCVLVICGYGFGDSHINIEIDTALRESAGNLTVIAFTSEDKPTNQLKKWNEDCEVREHV